MDRTQRIAELNDLLRTSFFHGAVVFTQGFSCHPHREEFIAQVRQFSDFNEDNDPFGEHDFGVVHFDGQEVFWKIDYYDLAMEFGSPDPANPEVTRRCLTLMLAEEY